MVRKKRYPWARGGADDAPSAPSRSQKKRDCTALQALGAELTRLPLAFLVALPLTSDLNEALRLMARISDHEGRRRQLQYIGRLMRECDVEALRAALDAQRLGHTRVATADRSL